MAQQREPYFVRLTMDRIRAAVASELAGLRSALELAGLRSALEGAEGDERAAIESQIRIRTMEAKRLGMEV